VKRMEWVVKFVVALLMVGGLLGLIPPAPCQADEPIVIGAAVPLTGPRALNGRDMRQGITLAQEEINAAGGVLGRPVQIVFEDDQGDNPNAAINAVNRLIHVHKVPLMLGPHFSVTAMATHKIYWEAKVISITGASAVSVTAQGNPYVFRVRANDGLVSKAMVAYARDTLKATRIAIQYINDDFGKAGMERVVKSMEEFQMKPAAVESHNSGDKDFTAQLSKITQAGAQVMISWSHDTEAALVVRQMKQLNPAIRVVGSTSLSMPAFLKLAGEASDGVISANDFVPTTPDARIQAWVAKYKAKYDMLPEIFAATYYDAAHIAAKVIAAAGGSDSEKMRQAFFALRYTGMLAEYRFESNGDGNHQIHMVEDEKGAPKWLSTVKF
jgi:branched-chain amino acid transport system substrate-binding protein